jgi:FkbM family methyltransferase
LHIANYRSVVGMARYSAHPLSVLRRYVTSQGEYPWRTRVRTPTGMLELELGHSHDVRTLHEIFFRHDYPDTRARVVVDVGANIGLASTYYLTRRPDAVVHAWEPVPANIDRLNRNTATFGDRIHVHTEALAPTAGRAQFRVEPVGRYGGLAEYSGPVHGEVIEVECTAVNDALVGVLATEGRIDVLKIDTEGSEPVLMSAVGPEVWAEIGTVVYEMPGRVVTATGAEMAAS